MIQRVFKYGNGALIGLIIAAGAYFNAAPAAAQTAPTCWATWCTDTTCVSVKIECPDPIKPI